VIPCKADFLKASMQQISKANIESGLQIKSFTYKVASFKVMCGITSYDINIKKNFINHRCNNLFSVLVQCIAQCSVYVQWCFSSSVVHKIVWILIRNVNYHRCNNTSVFSLQIVLIVQLVHSYI